MITLPAGMLVVAVFVIVFLVLIIGYSVGEKEGRLAGKREMLKTIQTNPEKLKRLLEGTEVLNV